MSGPNAPLRGAKVDWVLVDRLLATYDPFYGLGLSSSVDLNQYKPQPEWKGRGDIIVAGSVFPSPWHYGRIRFFRDELRAGRKLDPITIDNRTAGDYILAEVVLIDGHHRLAAASFVRLPKLAAHYSGRVDVLSYLKGRRKHMPSG